MNREAWLCGFLSAALIVGIFAAAGNSGCYGEGPRNDAELQAAVLQGRARMEEAQRARGEVVIGSAQWYNQWAEENRKWTEKVVGELRGIGDSVATRRDSLQAEAVARAVVRQLQGVGR